MRTSYKAILCSLWIALFLLSCEKDDSPGPEKAPAYTRRVNSFIYEYMKAYYLWNDRIPELDRDYEQDPEAYFKKLLVKEDLFSHITDDAEDLLNSMQGVETTFGYAFTYTWLDETQTKVGAIVSYVYPGSPAALAGIERGDLVSSLNGQALTETTLHQLFGQSSITIGVSKYENGLYSAPQTLHLTPARIEENPVYATRKYELQGTKVGSLCYLNYIGNYNFALDTAFSGFKQAGISELILDLRYNLGGDDMAIRHLCSYIAPESSCRSKELIIRQQYNNDLTEYYKLHHINNDLRFTDSLLIHNLDLKRIFILTSRDTYSASEATIVGLKPYMEVIQIGQQTGGKDTGLALLQPYIEKNGKIILDPTIGNWAILPIISRYQNKEGHSATGGLSPDYPVDSFYLPMLALGDPQDPLIAKALEVISGVTPVRMKSLSSSSFPQPFGYSTSMYDEIKKNIFINRTELKHDGAS